MCTEVAADGKSSEQQNTRCLGGYFPVGLSQEESNTMISSDPKRFAEFVKKRCSFLLKKSSKNSFLVCSLCRHIEAIGKLARRGMHFFDYGNLQEANFFGLQTLRAAGNSFLLECHRAGADVLAADANDDKTFIFPSYCQASILSEKIERNTYQFQDIMGDIFSVCLRFCSGNFAPRFAVIRGAKVAVQNQPVQ